jgi:hypothetical protein
MNQSILPPILHHPKPTQTNTASPASPASPAPFMSPSPPLSSRLAKNNMTILNQELHRQILGMHIRHLLLQAVVAHDGRRKDNSKILGGHLKNTHTHRVSHPFRIPTTMGKVNKIKKTHQVLPLPARHPYKVEHEKLETVPVVSREHVDRLSHVRAPLRLVLHRYTRQPSVSITPR